MNAGEKSMVTRRIAYISPGGSGLYDSYYQTILNKAALPGTEVTAMHLSLTEEDDSPFLSDYPFYHTELFRAIKQVQDNGYHAAIIGCSADPGLIEARRMVDMPVTAPLEANLYLASMLRKRRITILVPGTEQESILYMDLARAYGLAHTIASIIPVNLKYPSTQESARLMKEDPAQLANIILDCHRGFLEEELFRLTKPIVEHNNISAIYFGCTLWTGMLEPVAQRLKLPILDAGIGALRMAEILADRYQLIRS